MTRDFMITNEQGIHARPATELVQKANQFDSKMLLTYNDVTTDLKSIMGVLSLGITRGSLIRITIEGTDEGLAMKSIADTIRDINLKSK